MIVVKKIFKNYHSNFILKQKAEIKDKTRSNWIQNLVQMK